MPVESLSSEEDNKPIEHDARPYVDWDVTRKGTELHIYALGLVLMCSRLRDLACKVLSSGAFDGELADSD